MFGNTPRRGNPSFRVFPVLIGEMSCVRRSSFDATLSCMTHGNTWLHTKDFINVFCCVLAGHQGKAVLLDGLCLGLLVETCAAVYGHWNKR